MKTFTLVRMRSRALCLLGAALAGCVAGGPPYGIERDGNRHLPRAHGSAPVSAVPLENTYWKLLELHGRPVAAAERQREPHLVFQPALTRVVGFGGCNRLTGSYTLDGERLGFSRFGGTLMACPRGMEQERAFFEMLPTIARWRTDGQRLELIDERGGMAARFESRELH